MISREELRALLLAAFPDAEIDLEDMTGQQDHYAMSIVTSAFEGKAPLEQHQLVYGALGNAMFGPIHAMTLRTFTPAAWRGRPRETPS